MTYSHTREISSGFLRGWAGFSTALIVGVLLCLTGLGAILGIPIIIAGFIYPFTKSARAPILIGKCPYCGHEVHASKLAPGVTCDACKQRIIIKDGIFYTIN